jgi:hypothetical protein
LDENRGVIVIEIDVPSVGQNSLKWQKKKSHFARD